MQTRKHSLFESLWGTAIGFIISVAVWQWIVNPVWGFNTGIIDNLAITLLFTVVSVVRSYYVRRFFNAIAHKNKKKELHENQTYRDHRARPEWKR